MGEEHERSIGGSGQESRGVHQGQQATRIARSS